MQLGCGFWYAIRSEAPPTASNEQKQPSSWRTCLVYVGFRNHLPTDTNAIIISAVALTLRAIVHWQSRHREGNNLTEVVISTYLFICVTNIVYNNLLSTILNNSRRAKCYNIYRRQTRARTMPSSRVPGLWVTLEIGEIMTDGNAGIKNTSELLQCTPECRRGAAMHYWFMRSDEPPRSVVVLNSFWNNVVPLCRRGWINVLGTD